MSIGVATANSILLVTFANEMREEKRAGANKKSAEIAHVDTTNAEAGKVPTDGQTNSATTLAGDSPSAEKPTEEHDNHTEVMEAALAAGYTRFRPVIMTALAMILGMLPMSLGLGEGGEQNAPLGRAVIGGLLVATFTTLFFVPIMYTVLRRKYVPPINESSNSEDMAALKNEQHMTQKDVPGVAHEHK